jgi:hypothetical protein
VAEKIVVDVSLVGGLTPEARAAIRADALALFEAGVAENDPEKIEAAKRLLAQLSEAEAAGPAVERVAMTPEEEAQYAADQEEGAGQAAAEEMLRTNEATLRDRLRARVAESLELANKIENGTATPEERARAVVLALRGVVRLTVLELRELDETP